ncbi:HAD family hydrolase [Pelagibacteraceae bacterium]|nr:HAD family hydrolase [Pelagibacteraceae bacterium]
MKSLKKKILIFDVDGVLIDSKSNMHSAWKQVQQKHKLKHIKFEDYFKNIGRPFYDILKLIGIKKNYKEIKTTYEKESAKQIKKIKFFINVVSTIKKLKSKNYILNIVTSKDIKRTKKFLKDIIIYFKYIECNNIKTKGKPNPDQINFIISKLNAKNSDCVYIGDTHVDYLTAKNSSIDFIFAEWGYGRNYNYKYKCNNINELFKII